VVLLSLAPLLVFVGFQGRTLWSEWTTMRTEWSRVGDNFVVGYTNIHPNPSYAKRPDNWFHDEGDQTLLWSGWKTGAGHRWFRVGRGEVQKSHISLPIGRDVVRAIDHPMIEVGGGTIWSKIPAQAEVIGLEIQGVDCAYPLTVLNKVEVVNDVIQDHPILVSSNPRVSGSQAVSIYETMLDGQRVTMGLSGYWLDQRPVLYDRGTESLWVPDGDALRAVAGRHKGASLKRISQPTPVTWGDWRSHHPKSRLLVGADRNHPKPTL